MKILKYIGILFIALSLTNCEEYEAGVSPASGIAFAKSTVLLTADDTTVYNIEVQATSVSNVDRTFTFTVDDTSTAVEADYDTTGTVTIPAGELVGTSVLTIDHSTLAGIEVRNLVLNLEIPEGSSDYIISTRESFTISYSRPCTNVVLSFVFDNYPEETSWELFDGDNVLVASGEGYDDMDTATENLCLPDGTYTLVINDAYGDGFCCAYGNGSYQLTLNGTVLVNGSGQFGAFTSNTFTIGE